MKKLTVLIVILLVVAIFVAGCSHDENNPVGTNSKDAKITLDQLADLQPGTAVQMKEVGDRFWVAYYAGIDGNWELAEYELHEIESAIKKLDVTRPKRKGSFKSFIEDSVGPINEAVKAKKGDDFEESFDKAVKACNGCHKKEEKEFIKWKVPSQRPVQLETKPVK